MFSIGGGSDRSDFRSFPPLLFLPVTLAVTTRPRTELSVSLANARAREMERPPAPSTPAIPFHVPIAMRRESLPIREEEVLRPEIMLIAVPKDHAFALAEPPSNLLFDSHPMIRSVSSLNEFCRTISLLRLAHPISARAPNEICPLQVMFSSFHPFPF